MDKTETDQRHVRDLHIFIGDQVGEETAYLSQVEGVFSTRVATPEKEIILVAGDRGALEEAVYGLELDRGDFEVRHLTNILHEFQALHQFPVVRVLRVSKE